jgi:3-oxoadipate enol-lactonase
VAPALLLWNSLGTDLHMWDPQARALAGRFRVVRYDSRGHGRSDVPAGHYSLERLGHDLLALCDVLDIEQAHICGLSLGGQVALWLASHHPERVMRAVFADTAARIGTDTLWNQRIEMVRAGGMRAIRDAIVARFVSEPFRQLHPDVAERLGATMEATAPDGYVATCEALRDADLTASVSRIRAPSLIIVGALDVATPPTQAAALHDALAASELIILPAAAHLSNVEQPDTFTTHVLAFLTRA